MKDHGYVDAYHDGQILPQGPVPSRSIWIFRYYDVVDEEFGDGNRREIEFHARKLSEFLRHVRDAVRGPNEGPDKHRRQFRACLVAHSMGGLICRCYLQNPEIPDIDKNTGKAKRSSNKGVDKVFTYGTPHGGIEFRRGLGWAEGLRDFFDPNNAGNFGPRRMREFLALPLTDKKKWMDEKIPEPPLNTLNRWFPKERFFCLVGTDARDYGGGGRTLETCGRAAQRWTRPNRERLGARRRQSLRPPQPLRVLRARQLRIRVPESAALLLRREASTGRDERCHRYPPPESGKEEERGERNKCVLPH